MTVLLEHEEEVTSISFCPNQNIPKMLSTGRDGTLRIWNYQNFGEKVSDCNVYIVYLLFQPQLLQSSGEVLTVAWSPGGLKFATGKVLRQP
jgi:WD40 repeat protein